MALPTSIRRNGLQISIPPGDVHYKGQRILCPPIFARLLRRLMMRDFTPTETLLEEVHRDASVESMRVHVSNLRRVLRDNNIPLRIVHEIGRGYTLKWDEKTMLERYKAHIYGALFGAAVASIPVLAQTTVDMSGINIGTVKPSPTPSPTPKPSPSPSPTPTPVPPVVDASAIATRWTVEAMHNNTSALTILTDPTGKALTASTVRAAAQKACAVLPDPAKCLADLAGLSFTSLTASGPRVAGYSTLPTLNGAGLESYVSIWAVRQ